MQDKIGLNPNSETTVTQWTLIRQYGPDLQQNKWLSVLRLFTGVGTGIKNDGAAPPARCIQSATLLA